MAKEWAKPFYNSKAWKKARDCYIAERMSIDGGMCEVCKELPGYIVHHMIPLTPENIDNPDISLNFCNLKYECKACHEAEEVHAGWRGKRGGAFVFDENGQPFPRFRKRGFE